MKRSILHPSGNQKKTMTVSVILLAGGGITETLAATPADCGDRPFHTGFTSGDRWLSLAVVGGRPAVTTPCGTHAMCRQIAYPNGAVRHIEDAS